MTRVFNPRSNSSIDDDFLLLDASNDPITGELDITRSESVAGVLTGLDIDITNTSTHVSSHALGVEVDLVPYGQYATCMDFSIDISNMTGGAKSATLIKLTASGATADLAEAGMLVDLTSQSGGLLTGVQTLLDGTADNVRGAWHQVYSTGTNAFGVDADLTGAATNNYAFRASATGATNNWAFYAVDGKSFFEEDVQLGTNLITDADNTNDLGDSTNYWADLYLKGSLKDGTNSPTVANIQTAYDHSQDNTQAHTDYLLNNANDVTTGGIEMDYLHISATADHTFTDSSDDLVITNPNADKDIAFNVTRNATSGNILELQGDAGKVTVNAIDDGSYGLGGVLNITGNMTPSSITGMVGANPTVTGNGILVANLVQPKLDGSVTNIAFYMNPLPQGTSPMTIETIRTVAAAHRTDVNTTVKILTEQSIPRNFTNFGVTDSATIDYDFLKLGGPVTGIEFDAGGTGSLPTYDEIMVTLTGGVTRNIIAGAGSGSLNQVGLKLAGFGVKSGLIAGDSGYAFIADGGTFSHKYDYDAAHTATGFGALLFGAGEDAGIGYDGTDFVIETDLVGTGTLKTTSGRTVATARYTGAQTLDSQDHVVFCDTDGGAWTATLPAGVEGRHYRLTNVGTSGNDLTVDGDGAETVMGAATQTVSDGETVNIYYNATEGWW